MDKATLVIEQLRQDLLDAGFELVQVGARWRVTNPKGGDPAFIPHRLPKGGRFANLIPSLTAIGFDVEKATKTREDDRQKRMAADKARADAVMAAAEKAAQNAENPRDVQARALADAEAQKAAMLAPAAIEAEQKRLGAPVPSPFAAPAGAKGPRTDVFLAFDAEFAAELLKANRYYDPDAASGEHRTNRKFSVATAERYKKAMLAGEWELNHQGIGIDVEGNVVDGQHRLAALVDADAESRANGGPGVTIPLMVTYDLPVTAGRTVDAGLRRTVSAVLTMTGEVNANVLAGVVRIVSFQQQGFPPVQFKSYRVTSVEAERFLEAHPGLRDSVRASSAKVNVARPIAWAAAHYVLTEAGKVSEGAAKAVEAFFDQLKSGSGLEAGNPIHTVREYLIRQRTSNAPTQSLTQFAMLVKAFNAWAAGKNMTQAHWRPTVEAVPQVVKLK